MTQLNNLDSKIAAKIIEIRGKHVLLDSDVAELYNVETRAINQAISRNQDKFPDEYILKLTDSEWMLLKSQFVTSIKGGKTKLPTAFTEKALYMLATILKSSVATQTTIAIIETFSKLKEAERMINQLPDLKKDSPEQQKVMHQVGEIISELIIPDDFEKQESEASIELNFAVVKFKYSVKKSKK